jgi:Rha family phage regulatory protein
LCIIDRYAASTLPLSDRRGCNIKAYTPNTDIGVYMSNLTVIENNGQIVVDSRLVAEELGIEHPSFIRTIRKYSCDLMDFGHLGFEIGTVQNSVGAVNREIFCYLNEDQATFLMTLSRNTPQVVKCKKDLVKAFSKAKELVAQRDRLQLLEMLAGYEEIKKEVAETKKEFAEMKTVLLSLAGHDRKIRKELELVGIVPGLTDEIIETIAQRVEKKYKGKEVLWTNLRAFGRSTCMRRTLRKEELNIICKRFGWVWENKKVSI